MTGLDGSSLVEVLSTASLGGRGLPAGRAVGSGGAVVAAGRVRGRVERSGMMATDTKSRGLERVMGMVVTGVTRAALRVRAVGHMAGEERREFTAQGARG